MRWVLLTVMLVLGLAALILGRASQGAFDSGDARRIPSTSAAAPKPDFEKEVKPIFQSRCMPCHFQGGQVYDRMPFDKPETITRLGTKLFTRIKDEKQRETIRAFIDQP